MPESTRCIPLTQGYVAIVDACDFDRLNRYRWSAFEARPGIVYAQRQRTRRGQTETIYMHREALGLQVGDGLNADHRNHIGIDNRRENIRVATPVQNAMNRGRNRNNKSGYKGLVYNSNLAASRRWVAKLSIDGVQVTLGHFADPISAAKCYDQAAVAHYGEFAYQNFPTAVAA